MSIEKVILQEEMPNGSQLKRNLPEGNLVCNVDAVSSGTCQNPNQASNFEKTYASSSCSNVSSTDGSTSCSLQMFSLSLVKIYAGLELPIWFWEHIYVYVPFYWDFNSDNYV